MHIPPIPTTGSEDNMDALFYALPLAVAASAIFATLGVDWFF
jgi:hypothetical protein